MSAPLVPSPLDYVGPRRFALYPAIRDTGPNEWFLRGRMWAEVQVVNAHTGAQFWLPRQYVGGVSDVSGLILVVELTKELTAGEDGALAPAVKTVIEIPQVRTANAKGLAKRKRKRPRGPAPVVGIRPDPVDNVRARVLAKVGLGVIVVCVLSAILAAIARL